MFIYRYFIYLLLFIVCSVFPFWANPNASFYLDGRIELENMRYPTFSFVLDLLEKRGAEILVETGTARGGDLNYAGDGGATIIFGHWAFNHDAILYSVDIDKNALDAAQKGVIPFASSVTLVHSDSVPFLRNFNQRIDFLYLDSFDFNFALPLPSQLHHLREIEAAYPWLHDRSIVMIDDCDLPHGGKGKYVIEYLLERGWKILKNGYQVILVKDDS